MRKLCYIRMFVEFTYRFRPLVSTKTVVVNLLVISLY